MKKILFLGLSYELPPYPNLRNYYFFLKNRNHQFTFVGINASSLNREHSDIVVNSIKISKPLYYVILLLNLIHPWLREKLEYFLFLNVIKSIKKINYDAIIAFDLSSALILRNLNKKFIFDSHAYLPKEFDSKLIWNLTDSRFVKFSFKKIKENIISLISEDSFANYLYENERVFNGERFVVPLYSYYNDIKIIHENEGGIKIIHHGGANRDRKLERLINIISLCNETVELNIMLLPKNKYYKKLEKYAQSKSKRIHFIPAVPMVEIPKTINRFDLSLIIFGSNEFHHKFTSVPNKFWESLQGRIPIIASPNSAMAPIIRDLQIGFLPENDSDMAYVNLINSISKEQILQKKLIIESLAFEHSLEGFKPKFMEYFNSLPLSTSSKI